MDKKVHELLNEQINKELYSAYLILIFQTTLRKPVLTALPTGI